MIIKKAEIKDTANIAKIYEKLNTDKWTHYSDSEYVKSLIQKGEMFIAFEDNTPIAAIEFKIEKDDKNCEIIRVASTKKGGGKALVEFVEEECQKHDIKKIRLRSLEKYNAAGFWEKMGFTEKFLVKKQCDGENIYFLGKILK